MLKLTDQDIRDGESGRDYVRRISWVRKAFLLVFGLAAFTAAIAYMSLVFVTFRQLWQALPVWANLFMASGFVVLYLAAAVMMELRDRRRFRP